MDLFNYYINSLLTDDGLKVKNDILDWHDKNENLVKRIVNLRKFNDNDLQEELRKYSEQVKETNPDDNFYKALIMDVEDVSLGGVGQSSFSYENLYKMVHEQQFRDSLSRIIKECSRENYLHFIKTWEACKERCKSDVTKTPTTPRARINRLATACSLASDSPNLSLVFDEKKIMIVYDWLKSNSSINISFPDNKDCIWYDLNEIIMKELAKELNKGFREEPKLYTTNDNGKTWKLNKNNNTVYDSNYLSIFVWCLYDEASYTYSIGKTCIKYGAPGTGKTFTVKNEAISCSNFWKDHYGSNDSELIDNNIKIIQFHPSYSYEDFIEGLRPIVNNGKAMLSLQNGTFKAFCKGAGKWEIDLYYIFKILRDKVKKIIPNFKNDDEFDFDTLTISQLKRIFKILIIELELSNNLTDGTDNGNIQYSETADSDVNIIKANKPTIDDAQLAGKVEELLKPIKKELDNNKQDSYLVILASVFSASRWNYILKIKDENEKVVATLPPFFFIIDEINRAELSRVFGELMYCLEYRGPWKGHIETQYANLNNKDTGMLKSDTGGYNFFIPSNMNLIGTMNNIDRSVESFDFALRRRFRWERIKPNKDALNNYLAALGRWSELLKWWVSLNNVIRKHTDLLGEDYCIGHAYLMKLDKYGENLAWNVVRQKIWDDAISPLLEEYLRGTGAQGEEIMKECRKAFFDKIVNE